MILKTFLLISTIILSTISAYSSSDCQNLIDANSAFKKAYEKQNYKQAYNLLEDVLKSYNNYLPGEKSLMCDKELTKAYVNSAKAATKLEDAAMCFKYAESYFEMLVEHIDLSYDMNITILDSYKNCLSFKDGLKIAKAIFCNPRNSNECYEFQNDLLADAAIKSEKNSKKWEEKSQKELKELQKTSGMAISKKEFKNDNYLKLEFNMNDINKSGFLAIYYPNYSKDDGSQEYYEQFYKKCYKLIWVNKDKITILTKDPACCSFESISLKFSVTKKGLNMINNAYAQDCAGGVGATIVEGNFTFDKNSLKLIDYSGASYTPN